VEECLSAGQNKIAICTKKQFNGRSDYTHNVVKLKKKTAQSRDILKIYNGEKKEGKRFKRRIGYL